MAANGRRENEPPTFISKRASVVTSLAHGQGALIAGPLMRYLTPAQKVTDRGVAWKLVMRMAKAHAGLCRELIAGRAKTSDEARNEAGLEQERAEKCKSLCVVTLCACQY